VLDDVQAPGGCIARHGGLPCSAFIVHDLVARSSLLQQGKALAIFLFELGCDVYTISAGVTSQSRVSGGGVLTGECNGRSLGIGQTLRAAVKFSPALLFLAVLAGCNTAQTTTFEPQNQPLDGRQGRLYLIRHSSVMSGYGAPPIKANGKLVGELAAGTYFVIDRPPGTHKITVYGIRDTIGCETDVSFQPGMSHYFELGPIVRTNMEGIIADSMGVTGRPVPCKSGHSSQFMFYSLDSAAGAAVIAKLKRT